MLFVDLSLITFIIYVLPDVTQLLYWFTGMSTYLSPVGFNFFLLGLIFWAAHSSKPVLQLPIIFVTALLAGGFSETTAVMQFTWIMGLILLIILLSSRSKFRTALIPLIVASIATVISILILAYSPATNIRLEGLHTTPPNLIQMLVISIKYTVDFIYTTLKGEYIPFILIFCLGFFFFFMRKPANEATPIPKQVIIKILAIAIGCFIIIAASIAPSVYAQNAYPGERALFPARFILITTLFATGFYIGSIVPRSVTIFRSNFNLLVTIFGVLFTLALGAYMVRASNNINGYIPKFQKWADYWDARDAVIREDKQNGILDVRVMNLDHVIYDLIELTSNPKAGYNQCAATYYGVNSIIADLPGWDQ